MAKSGKKFQIKWWWDDEDEEMAKKDPEYKKALDKTEKILDTEEMTKKEIQEKKEEIIDELLNKDSQNNEKQKELKGKSNSADVPEKNQYNSNKSKDTDSSGNKSNTNQESEGNWFTRQFGSGGDNKAGQDTASNIAKNKNSDSTKVNSDKYSTNTLKSEKNIESGEKRNESGKNVDDGISFWPFGGNSDEKSESSHNTNNRYVESKEKIVPESNQTKSNKQASTRAEANIKDQKPANDNHQDKSNSWWPFGADENDSSKDLKNTAKSNTTNLQDKIKSTANNDKGSAEPRIKDANTRSGNDTKKNGISDNISSNKNIKSQNTPDQDDSNKKNDSWWPFKSGKDEDRNSKENIGKDISKGNKAEKYTPSDGYIDRKEKKNPDSHSTTSKKYSDTNNRLDSSNIQNNSKINQNDKKNGDTNGNKIPDQSSSNSKTKDINQDKKEKSSNKDLHNENTKENTRADSNLNNGNSQDSNGSKNDFVEKEKETRKAQYKKTTLLAGIFSLLIVVFLLMYTELMIDGTVMFNYSVLPFLSLSIVPFVIYAFPPSALAATISITCVISTLVTSYVLFVNRVKVRYYQIYIPNISKEFFLNLESEPIEQRNGKLLPELDSNAFFLENWLNNSPNRAVKLIFLRREISQDDKKELYVYDKDFTNNRIRQGLKQAASQGSKTFIADSAIHFNWSEQNAIEALKQVYKNYFSKNGENYAIIIGCFPESVDFEKTLGVVPVELHPVESQNANPNSKIIHPLL